MPPKKSKSGKKPKKIIHDEEEDSKEQNTNEEPTSQSSLRRVEVLLDPELDVPVCYVKYFTPEPKDSDQPEKTDTKKQTSKKEYLFKIEVNRKKGKKTSTTISWDSKKQPLTKSQINDLKKKKKDLGTDVTEDKNTLVFFGDFCDFFKGYLVDTLQIPSDQIYVKTLKPEVPSYFKIKITAENESDTTKVKWNPKTWQNKSYTQFVDEFRKAIIEDMQLPEPEEFKRTKNYVFTIKGKNISDKLIEYFTSVWSIDEKQIEILSESIPSEPVIVPEIPQSHIKNPFAKMREFFADFDNSSYFKKMADTIEANYLNQLQRLENLIIKTNLKFAKNGSDGGSDKSGKNAWVTTFNVLNAIGIDGVASGRFLSEGDTVMIKYLNRKRFMKGSIVEMKKGKVTALFKIKYGRVPPGCKHTTEEKEDDGESDSDFSDDENDENKQKEKNEEEEEENDNDNNEEEDDDDDDFDDYDDDYDKDIEEDEEENKNVNDDSKYPYTISFKPSDSVYQRCSLALLNLYEMPNSPIKKIISGEQISSSSNANKSSNEVIDDSSFDLTDSTYLNEDDKNNNDFMKFLKLDATVSQTRCVEMILQNSISIVHGPPGCGKTSSISLFVYHLLRKMMNEKKRILLCAFSNQAVENIVKFVSPIVKALGKKMIWITRKNMDFETKKNFDEASEEEKNLSVYQILKRNTKEANKFKKLQEIKWDLYVKMKEYHKARKENKYYPDGKPRRFSINEQNKMDDLRNLIEQNLVNEADVVCSTLLTSAKMNMVSFKFDYIFIDEASQANQIYSIIPLIHRPSKLVLLGDHKQLDAMIPEELKGKYDDTMKSLYRKLLKNKIQHEMLNVQFRMNPLIAQFPSQEFYKNRIINAPNMAEKTFVELQQIPTPIAFIDVKEGKERKCFGTSYRNFKEAEVVERIIYNFKKNRINSKDVGVITPYHGQVHILRKKINKLDYNGLRISSVDTFQGSERDFIVLSLVRTNNEGKFGFLPDKHRLNVSLTRARKGLIIVGNFTAMLNSNKNGHHDENQFLVDMCQFYKNKDAVKDQSEIERIKILIEKSKNSNEKTNSFSIKMVPNNKTTTSSTSSTVEKQNSSTDTTKSPENQDNNNDDDDDDVFGGNQNNLSSPTNSVDITTQPMEFEYDVDSDLDDNAVTADDDAYYKT